MKEKKEKETENGPSLVRLTDLRGGEKKAAPGAHKFICSTETQAQVIEKLVIDMIQPSKSIA